LPDTIPTALPAAFPALAPGHVRHGSSIGQPLTRRDGALKVTGAARFAADNHPPGMLHAVMAVASIAHGRVRSLDIAAARAHPGVVEVMTSSNAPKLARHPDQTGQPFTYKLDLLQDERVRYANQPIAVVIAETLEAATEGALLLRPTYAAEPSSTSLDQAERFVPDTVGVGSPPNETSGDVAAGLADADSRIEATYDTAPQYHNAMEPHAVVARWDGERLFLDTPSQGLSMAQARIAGLFGIDAADIHIESPFLGGGFGSKGAVWAPQVLGIMAARLVGRPVKLVTRREQMFGPVGHRAPTRQTLRLGADRDGHLTAVDHHTLTASSTFDDFFEPSGRVSHTLYETPNLRTTHEAVRLDTGTPFFMRAPGEASGSAALESAVDELAEACGMDPLAFRIANYAEQEPKSGKPFTSKKLRDCYARGAERFGWASRPLQPRTLQDEAGLLVGWGMGTASFPALMMQATARATLHADGTGLIELGAHDMGQGAWTAFAQIGADGLGLDAAAVGNQGVVARDGRLHRKDDEQRSERYADILARAGRASLSADGKAAPNAANQAQYAAHAHGAVFAEVKIHPTLGQIRVTRLVGAFAAGAIINPRLVTSQYYGGMIWGVSFALHEHALHDPRTGRVMNANLAEYRVPVNADIPDMEAILVEEDDPYVNALGVKGVGEIGITGTVGAIANAVWHATGIRVRRLPITLDRLL
jgi:xanthine dehydrogenase YagR molybdenum-binding subunit